MDTVPQIRAAMADPTVSRDAISAALDRIADELHLIAQDANIALGHAFNRDLRPAVLVYLHDLARVHGRTPSEQLAVCIAERDPWFQKLALVAWGISL